LENAYRKVGRDSHPDHVKRVPNNQLAIQKYLNMVDAELLELNACKHVHISHVPLQLLQLKVDVRFRYDLHFLYSKNPRGLAKFAKAATPPRPQAELQQADRKCRSRQNVDHSYERLKTVQLLPNIFT